MKMGKRLCAIGLVLCIAGNMLVGCQEKSKEQTEMKDMEILSRKTTEIIKNEKYIIEADYIVLMNIAKEQPIDSDVPWENTDDMS